MEKIQANECTELPLGRQGENFARQIIFDISDWISEYGAGTVELIVQRPGESSPYPAIIEQDESTVLWTLTSSDTWRAGTSGHCELRCRVNDILVKSKVFCTSVEPAISGSVMESPPPSAKTWVERVYEVGEDALNAASSARADAELVSDLVLEISELLSESTVEEVKKCSDLAEAAKLEAQAFAESAKSYASTASSIASEVAENAMNAEQDASYALTAKDMALDAQRLAEKAQQAAETAKQAAETAQEIALQSSTDAEAAKESAIESLQSAKDAVAEAAQSLSDIRVLYEQIQAFASGVVQSVTDEGNKQVDAVLEEGAKYVQALEDNYSGKLDAINAAGDTQTQRITDEGNIQTANAKSYADAAALSATHALQSATSSEESRIASDTSASSAASSEANAKSYAISASASMSESASSAAEAANSDASAKLSEQNAKESENAAKAFAAASASSADAASLSASAAAQSANESNIAKDIAEAARNAAVEAEINAESAKKGAEQAQSMAETAAIKQPYPNAETGTWWTWDAETAAYVDSGEPYEGTALYATFGIDPLTGKLSVCTPARYHGPEFSLNETTGKLEVTVNG